MSESVVSTEVAFVLFSPETSAPAQSEKARLRCGRVASTRMRHKWYSETCQLFNNTSRSSV